jgi:hypothetical protein
MTTVRLALEMDEKLEAAAKADNTSKSNIIKLALEQYFYREEEESSWVVGEPYFGKYGSGDGNLSSEYKERLKGKISGKYHID